MVSVIVGMWVDVLPQGNRVMERLSDEEGKEASRQHGPSIQRKKDDDLYRPDQFDR